ncbi:NlpC/P60 family protein [Vibrio sp. M250220]|uniref:NlpC/P60 family protein n=1 Tax=Vibrio sp. M250220 TaxID=3020894 RepID=UPI002F405226
MYRYSLHLSLNAIILTTLLTACSSSPQQESQPASATYLAPNASQLAIRESLIKVYDQWEGVPYRLGGSSLNGVDCSAFVQTAFQQAMGIQLPRTTLDQVKVGTEIAYSQATIGDLVFFKTAPNTRHVGVYIGGKQFMHASTSKGVVISRLDNPYWASKYWHFRRVSLSPEIN